MASSSAHRNPVVPSVTTSGAAPSGKASTGVPQAMASIMTMPKGSFHRMGKRRADGPGQQLELALVGHLAQVDGVGAEQGLHLLGEVLHLPRLAHLGGHQDPHAGPPGDLDGPVAALVVGHPAEEQDVGAFGVAPAVAHGELGGLHAVVDDPRHRDLGCRPVLGVGDGDQGAPGPTVAR